METAAPVVQNRLAEAFRSVEKPFVAADKPRDFNAALAEVQAEDARAAAASLTVPGVAEAKTGHSPTVEQIAKMGISQVQAEAEAVANVEKARSGLRATYEALVERFKMEAGTDLKAILESHHTGKAFVKDGSPMITLAKEILTSTDGDQDAAVGIMMQNRGALIEMAAHRAAQASIMNASGSLDKETKARLQLTLNQLSPNLNMQLTTVKTNPLGSLGAMLENIFRPFMEMLSIVNH